MTGLWTVTKDSFLLMRRDKVFIPAIFGGIILTILANIASDWTLEEYAKVLFDLGAFGFHIIGSIVAIFWGTKAISDARSEGSLEMQVSTPISRPVCLLGKYFGLILNLTLIAVILVAFWQAVMLTNSYLGKMTNDQLMVFLYVYLGWCVTAAVAIFFASFCSHATALFSSFSAWLVGLTSAQIAAALAPDTPKLTRTVVEASAWIWDFQRFNLNKYLVSYATKLQGVELMWNAVYGLSLIALLMTAACLIFRKRTFLSKLSINT
ncbi:MAG: ABC transporter permease subunit [Bdellovibrionota bacterium]